MCKCKAGVEVINDGTMVWCLECGAKATLVWEKVLPKPKACPFCCETVAHVVKATEVGFKDDDDEDMYVVWCSNIAPYTGPEGCGSMSGFYFTEEEAIDAWNRRCMEVIMK